jgi:hypothetical protein
MLPERNRQAEDAFLERWRDFDDTEALIAVITEAIEGRRPQLAARLVSLLDEQVEVEPGSALERASRAGRMLMLPEPSPEAFQELQAAWILARRMRIRRITRRMRPNKDSRGRPPRSTRR